MVGWVYTVQWFFNKDQLLPLGITDQHVYFVLGLLGVAVCYYFLGPVVRLMVALKWDKLITFVMGSLILLMCAVVIQQSEGVYPVTGQTPLFITANIALGIVFFGVALFIVQLSKSIASQMKNRKSNSFMK